MATACSSEQLNADALVASESSTTTAADFDVGPVLAVEAYLVDPRFADADVERGATLSLACVVCHTLRPGENHMLGPNLGHVFGAAAGKKAGFSYSGALAESGLVWTPQALDAWLAEPASFVPGTTMVFAGYSASDDRRDLIAYLLRATDSGTE
jgi:cytochrome c